jgi:hypothetical protein
VTEEQAYEQGRKDAVRCDQIPLACQAQEVLNLSDEATICYLNGVGDALADGDK